MKGRTIAPIIGVILIFVVGLLAIPTVEYYWHRSKPVVHPRNISNRGVPFDLIDDGEITGGWVGLEIAGAGTLRIEVAEITYGNVAQFHIDGFAPTTVELPYSRKRK